MMEFTIAAPNPLSFGGQHPERFEPEDPGIAGFARHPLLVALALWAFAHIIPNGDIASILLFGTLGLFAVLGMALIDRRQRAEFGNAEWTKLAEGTSNWPLHAWFTGRSTPKIMASVQRICFAVLLWACLIWAHATLFGVSPWPV